MADRRTLGDERTNWHQAAVCIVIGAACVVAGAALGVLIAGAW